MRVLVVIQAKVILSMGNVSEREHNHICMTAIGYGAAGILSLQDEPR